MPAGATSATPCMRSRNGRHRINMPTSTAAGLPGKHSTGRPSNMACAKGLPGLMARRHSRKAPASRSTCTRWSASPTEAPPVVSTRSARAAARRSADAVASRSSGTMPRSMGSHPRPVKSACTNGRLESKIRLPSPACSVSGCPTSMSSSPVEKKATFGRGTTGKCRAPAAAARAMSWARRTWPGISTEAPAAKS